MRWRKRRLDGPSPGWVPPALPPAKSPGASRVQEGPSRDPPPEPLRAQRPAGPTARPRGPTPTRSPLDPGHGLGRRHPAHRQRPRRRDLLGRSRARRHPAQRDQPLVRDDRLRQRPARPRGARHGHLHDRLRLLPLRRPPAPRRAGRRRLRRPRRRRAAAPRARREHRPAHDPLPRPGRHRRAPGGLRLRPGRSARARARGRGAAAHRPRARRATGGHHPLEPSEQQRTLWATGTLGNGLRHATAVHLLEHDGPPRRGRRQPRELHDATRLVLLVDQTTDHLRDPGARMARRIPPTAVRTRLADASHRPRRTAPRTPRPSPPSPPA